MVDFKVNQDFIARVLCINKEKPITMCNGKCYLTTQLKKQDEQEKHQVPQDINEKIEILFINENTLEEDRLYSSLSERENNFFYKSPQSNNHLEQVFRPPILA